MNNFVNAMDNLPWIVKILLCLPVLDLIWAIYRIVKGASTNSVLKIVVGILWIIIGTTVLWIVDLICTLISKKPTLFA